jgi:Family of unknown function (DUF6510)
MEPLDGNAIAGPLMEHFGNDMTLAVGACGHCGATGVIGELRVYARGPGSVVRCRVCGNVVIVVVEQGDQVRVDFAAFRLSPAPS